MNGPHDLGGAQGFGPIAPETNEPVFHAEWERRAAALSLAMNATGMWNIDIVRHSRERIPPAEYLAASYYEKWLKGLERLLVENGLVTDEELENGPQHQPAGVIEEQAGCRGGARDACQGPALRPASKCACALQRSATRCGRGR